MKPLFFAVIATLVFVSAPAMAGDAAAGKAKSAMCASCHGADGIGLTPLYPNLAGQKEAYLVKQMKAFRDGTRKDPLMAPMSMALTDEDIANLAAYYAGM
jgi:cytochrome c553